jgi:SAM-dependent methyltransferase
MSVLNDDAEQGAREPFEDAALYDYEYRHRRADVTFYRRLAQNRMEFGTGPILDLACGSGRLLFPLVRDGHWVLGIDRSWDMLAQARRRLRRLSPLRRSQVSLVRADLRHFTARPSFAMAFSAFHSVQHLYTDAHLVQFFQSVRTSLWPRGWFAFDVLPPNPDWLARDPNRRFGRTRLRHPLTRQRYIYTNNHTYDRVHQLLHMRFFYQPIDAEGRPSGEERIVRLCHRQLWPKHCQYLLKQAGFRILATFSDWDGRLLEDFPDGAEEHIYLASTAG